MNNSMNVNKMHILKPADYQNINIKPTPAETHAKFADSLKEAINKVNDAQNQSSKITDKFISGEVDNLHDVMIAAQKASVTRTMAVEVRNKVIEAYKEVMRMQV